MSVRRGRVVYPEYQHSPDGQDLRGYSQSAGPVVYPEYQQSPDGQDLRGYSQSAGPVVYPEYPHSLHVGVHKNNPIPKISLS